MTKLFPASRFCVDAGNVSAVDEAYIREQGGDEDATDTCTIAVRPGKYKVRLRSSKTWRGRVSKTKVITVKGKGIIVGDICYSFSSAAADAVWDKFVGKTDCFRKLDGRGVCLDTGGDGIFEVEVRVEEVK